MPADPRAERLIAALRLDLEVMERLAARLEGAWAKRPWAQDDAIIYLVAVSLDHFYSAFEAALERVARVFEGLPERGAKWHKELLESGRLTLEGVRPALITAGTHARLSQLLEFRHFMRHAYAVELDPTRLESLTEVALGLREPIAREVEAFVAALRS